MNKKAVVLGLLGFILGTIAIIMECKGLIRLAHCQWQPSQCVENPQSIIDVLWPLAVFVGALGLFKHSRKYRVVTKSLKQARQ